MAKKPATTKQETTKQETTKQVAVKDENVMVPGAPLPEHLQQFVQQAQSDTGSMILSSISVPRISYRGKRWRFIVDGEEEVVKDPAIQVIIVGVEPEAGRFIKTFYATAYAPGSNEPPDCSSANGIYPDVWVTSPQAARCNQCPNNVFGSAQSRTGGKAKACHDGKRLWVLRADDLETVYGLNVPVMTLKNLAEYGRYIAKNQYPLSLVITELSMDDDSEFPKIAFNHVGFVRKEDVNQVVSLNTTRPWKTFNAPLIPYDAGADTTSRSLPPGGPSTLGAQAGQPPVTAKPGVGIDQIIGDWKK